MPKLVKMSYDIWPFGCRGDVIALNDDELAELKKKAKARNIDHPYEEVKKEESKDASSKK